MTIPFLSLGQNKDKYKLQYTEYSKDGRIFKDTTIRFVKSPIVEDSLIVLDNDTLKIDYECDHTWFRIYYQDKLIENFFLFSNSGKFYKRVWHKYEYNKEGQLLSDSYWEANSPLITTYYQYDEKGNLINKDYELLKQYNSIIDSNAVKFSDTIRNKNGLFQIDSVKSTHFDYYCSITEPLGNTIAKGYYKNNIPVGVWIKYNKSTDSKFNEYFFMENGICMKHVFYWHHEGSYFMDSLTSQKDTLIRMSFNTKIGQRDYFYIPKKGEQDYFEWKDINFKGIVVYPTSIYSYPIKREDWTEKGIVYKEVYRK